LNESRLLFLDVDEVLIDPCGSFEECAALALAEIAPSLTWLDELYWAFKRILGFNNDFRLAAMTLYEFGQINGLHEFLNDGLTKFWAARTRTHP
jgi:hypothetical protein